LVSGRTKTDAYRKFLAVHSIFPGCGRAFRGLAQKLLFFTRVMTTKTFSAPILSRVKSWQFIGLGLSGWCTLYSIALVAGSAMIGQIQGGCFAATMTLAGVEARRFRSETFTATGNSLGVMHTDELNRTLAAAMQRQEYVIETSLPTEKEMGFGVRAVKSGRTIVFETGRWQEPVINLTHTQTTEENRKKVYADIAYIVSLGLPSEEARNFTKNHPVKFLGRRELMAKFAAETAAQETKSA
jgi:hypothetical protein